MVNVKAIVELDLSLADLLYLGGKPCDMNALGAVVYPLLAVGVFVSGLLVHSFHHFCLDYL